MDEASIEPLRLYLIARRDDAELRRMSEADYGHDAEEILREFDHLLRIGRSRPDEEHDYPQMGSPWECCLLSRHEAERPWVAMCSVWMMIAMLDLSRENVRILLDNEEEVLLAYTVKACGKLGPEAARAAIPFVMFIAKLERPYAPEEGIEPSPSECDKALDRLREMVRAS